MFARIRLRKAVRLTNKSLKENELSVTVAKAGLNTFCIKHLFWDTKSVVTLGSFSIEYPNIGLISACGQMTLHKNN